MTTKQAIHLLHRLQDEQFDGPHGDERREALSMAVRALEGDGDTISRQQAIDALDKHIDTFDAIDTNYLCGLRTAMSILKEMPSAQPERPEQPESAKEYCAECNHIEMCRWYPYEGCEFRSLPSAQPDLDEWCTDCKEYDDKLHCCPRWNRVIRQALKDAHPQRKKGKWIKLDMHAHIADHKCTACGQECYVPTCMGEPMYIYCPNCGARMDGEANE